MSVNKERVALLVAALESGKYKQTTGSLCDVNVHGELCHCCLGVACEVAILGGLNVHKREPYTDIEGDSRSGEYDNFVASLPPSVMDWYGFKGSDPYLDMPDGDQNVATDLNDSMELSFPEIAAAFRRTFL